MPIGMFENLAQRLEGRIVVLEPLGLEHVEGIRKAAADERIWTWMLSTDPARPGSRTRWAAT
jgi:hypothetical protein